MNKKGFTLIELLAVIILLGIVAGITIVSVRNIYKETKEKSEDAFVATIKDAMEMYLTSSEAKGLSFSSTPCTNTLKKAHNSRTKVYKTTTTFQSVINSEYEPITEKDLINPSNEEHCSADFSVTIYRDEDFVYYYMINGSALKIKGTTSNCLTKSVTISNLPEGFSC